uniref:Uncharacterized protein n=1 Tax=Anopheles albimanus TaxID=7167 RepID=A0A182FE93_ANOAL
MRHVLMFPVVVMPLLVLVLVLLLEAGMVQADYENTWNSYYEQPCCGGTANGPFHLRHHGGHSKVLPESTVPGWASPGIEGSSLGGGPWSHALALRCW